MLHKAVKGFKRLQKASKGFTSLGKASKSYVQEAANGCKKGLVEAPKSSIKAKRILNLNVLGRISDDF